MPKTIFKTLMILCMLAPQPGTPMEKNHTNSNHLIPTKFALVNHLTTIDKDYKLVPDIAMNINQNLFKLSFSAHFTGPTVDELWHAKKNNPENCIFSISSPMSVSIKFMAQFSEMGPFTFHSIAFAEILEFHFKSARGNIVILRALQNGKFIQSVNCYIDEKFRQVVEEKLIQEESPPTYMAQNPKDMVISILY